MDDPRNDPNGVSVPFIFVARGDPLPVPWMAEHPDTIKVPAVMVPHGTRPPPPWGDAGAGAAAAALKPVPAAEARILGSFAPPPARRKCLPNGQPWPQDRNGRDWPKDRWGRPTRPLWDYPPGVRAPGEGVAPGGVGEAEAIAAYRRMATGFDRSAVRQASAQAEGFEPRQTLPQYGPPSPSQTLRGGASYYRDTATASGRPFDPNAMTAAMLHVAFGTVVTVTLANNPDRSIDVTIIDRGPYAIGRIIDLTRAAFIALVGSTHPGVVQVVVTVP